MWRIKLASGQAAAKASRTRDAISIARAPMPPRPSALGGNDVSTGFQRQAGDAEDAGLVIDHEYFGRSLVIA